MGLTQKLGTIPLAIQTDSSNNVGIGGAANASYKLAVTGASLFTGAATFSTSVTAGSGVSRTGGFLLNFAANTSSRNWRITNDELVFGDFAIMQSTTQTGTNYTFPFYVNPLGSVGIGTSSPNANLEVSTTNALGSFARFRLNSPYYNNWDLLNDSGLAFIRGTSEYMRITTGSQLQVKQSANGFTEGFRLINTLSNTWTLVNGGDSNLYFGYNGSSSSVITPAGTYIALSDINKKKDFEESTIGLNAILGIKPTLYRMKEDEDTSEKQLGFIAQQVKEFIPQAYVETDLFVGLTDRPIIAALVKAIQELNAKVTALEQKA